MRDDGNRAAVELVDQLGEVIDEAIDRVIAVGRPGAVAMAAQIGRDDVVMVAQPFGDPVPVAAMVAAAVDEQQGRCARIAPIDIMELEPLRDKAVRGGAGTCHRIILVVWSSFKRRLVSIRQPRIACHSEREDGHHVDISG